MDLNSLTIFKLATCGHDKPEDGLCAMEAVAWLEGLAHTDHPACTCPVIAAYVRRLNDLLGDKDRQRLVAYLPRLVGTVSPEHQKARAEAAAWNALRVFAPIALDLRGFGEHAAKLRASQTLAEGGKLARAAAAAASAAYAAAYAAAADAYAAAYAAANAAYVYAAAAAAADAYAAAYAAAAAADAYAYANAAAVYAAAAAKSRRAKAIEACKQLTDAAFECLDEMLAIGPSGTFSRDVAPAVEAYRQMVGA